MIVVDASAVLEGLLRPAAARVILDRLLDPRETLHAPHLIDLEVAQVIRRYCAGGDLDGEAGGRALERFSALRIRLYPHGPLLRRVWALRHNLTAYDAAYVALAERLDAPLVTRDRRLAAASGHRARVEVV